MKNVLVVSGHPDVENSFANKIILEEFAKISPDAKTYELGKLYPDFKIDVKAEQERLMKADVIVLQFPFFWYSVPSLMQKWFEDVLVHGFSHGSKGDKLKGKILIASFTSGASEDMYQKGALQNHTVDEFLAPLEQLAILTGMKWGGYVYSGGLSYASRNDESKLAQMRAKAKEHAKRLSEFIKNL
ncbi:NAD(P)H-dependent oxidoreductase [Campylobacter curvus]|uniref:NAD(P)H-dependent oxidoreductase n=1 Tax=Campylobacter curvus TaxID=200 RepID=UPI0014704640|nr:NAD(P)H-dependent oxidoreductase [Campylobacter curvus]